MAHCFYNNNVTHLCNQTKAECKAAQLYEGNTMKFIFNLWKVFKGSLTFYTREQWTQTHKIQQTHNICTKALKRFHFFPLMLSWFLKVVHFIAGYQVFKKFSKKLKAAAVSRQQIQSQMFFKTFAWKSVFYFFIFLVLFLYFGFSGSFISGSAKLMLKLRFFLFCRPDELQG